MDLPNESVSASLIAHYAKISGLLRSEIAKPPLVLPNAKFFPDSFAPTQAGVLTLLKRLQSHAGVADIPIQVQLHGARSPGGSACSSGGCRPDEPMTDQPRIVDTGEHWQLNFEADEVHHPVALTTLLARCLSAIVLEEVRGGRRVPEPAEVSCDLAAVQLGFGPLLLEGSYIYSKSCGGPNISKRTGLAVNELGVVVALFAAENGYRLGAAKRNASTTQRATLRLGEELISNNSSLVRALQASPDSIAAKDFSLKAPKPRWWGLFDKTGEDDALERALLDEGSGIQGAAAPNRQLAVERKRGTSEEDELKRLVSESLSESRAG